MPKRALLLTLAILVAAAAGADASRDTERPEWNEVRVPGDPELWDVAVEGSTVWLGTQGEGLVGIAGRDSVVHKVADGGIRQDSWNYVVFIDAGGDKWVTRDGGNTLDRLDDGGTLTDKTDDVWSYYSYPEDLANRRVFSVAQDAAGNRWFGMRDENHNRVGTLELMIEEPDSVRWLHFDNTWTPDSTFFSDDDVRALAVDRENRLWIGYAQLGVDVWDYGDPEVFADDAWIHYSTMNGLPSDLVKRIHVDPSGRVWVGTLDGLAVFDPADETWHTIEGLPGREATAIASDYQGHVWVGTNQGAAVLYRTTEVAFTYDSSDGLVDESIEEIAVDPVRGFVWAISRDESTSETHLNALESPVGEEKSIFPIFPNPWKEGESRGFVNIYAVPDGSSIEVFDLTGQRVRRLEDSSEPYEWDTLDGRGNEVPSGVYMIRIETPLGEEIIRKVAIVR